MAYGYIQTAGNVARQLKELNRDYRGRKTWGSLYGAVDLQRQQSLGDLGYDYDSQVAKAYATAYQQKSAIANSALGSGFKEQGQLDVDVALQEAFNTYRQNYLSSAAQIEQTALGATSQIDAMLEQEAQNYVDYEASAYSYLQYLYDQAYPGENANYDANADLAKMFAENSDWSKYIMTSEDEFGNKTSRLMTEQELRRRNFDLDASGQGTINKAGVDFYDQMLNQLSTEDSKYSFHNWLSKENPELYEWSQSGNAFDYTEAGTNIGTFKKMVGLKSTDDEYKFIERFGGMTEQDVTTHLQSFSKDIEGIINSGETDDTMNAKDAYSSALTNVQDYVNKLNLDETTKTEITNTISNLQSNINKIDVKNTSNWDTLVHTLEVVNEADATINPDSNVDPRMGLAISTFAVGLYMDIMEFLLPRSTTAVKNIQGDKRAARVAGRKTSNKEAIANIEQSYLDLMTLLASYAK